MHKSTGLAAVLKACGLPKGDQLEPNLPPILLLASVAVRTIIVFIVLVIAVRILGKREFGEMNLIDVVAILLVGNAIQNAMTYGSGRLEIGLVSSAVLLLIDVVIGLLVSWRPKIEQDLVGQPTIIFVDGYLDRQEMKRQGVEEDELLEAVRSMGLKDLDQVHLAVLEDNGSISVIPKPD
jgi:uncharacterized membrane protein YcaP (DUF421 family)